MAMDIHEFNADGLHVTLCNQGGLPQAVTITPEEVVQLAEHMGKNNKLNKEQIGKVLIAVLGIRQNQSGLLHPRWQNIL